MPAALGRNKPPAQAALPERVQAAPLALPSHPDGAPDGAVGCVVVGFLVGNDGGVLRPRAMQQVFSNDVPEESRAVFVRSALAKAGTWRFVPQDEDEWDGGFVMRTVGFQPAPAGGIVVSEGVDRQSPRLGGHCVIEDLASWGEENSTAVEAAVAANAGKVMLARRGAPVAAWTIREMPAPDFPKNALRAGVSGCVMLGITVGEDGVPREFRVMSSRASIPDKGARTVLENASLKAATVWRFAPGPDNFARVAQFMQVPVTYGLDGPWVGRKCEVIDPAQGDQDEQR